MKEYHIDVYADGDDPEALGNYIVRRLGNSLQYVEHGCVVMAIYDSNDQFVKFIVEGVPTPALQEVINGLGKAS